MVVRPRGDQGSRCADKDRSEETEDWALISASNTFKFVYKDYIYYSLVKPDPCFSSESQALQDSNNRASDDEPATVP